MTQFIQVCSTLANGFVLSVSLFVLTLLLALPLGLVMAFCTMSKFKPLSWISKVIIWVLRGTPLMLQIFAIFYLPGILNWFVWPQMNTGWLWFDATFDTRFIAALVAFAINYAAYFSEIFRGGIQSISKGQYEAGTVLGMSKGQIFFHIILMQVVKRILAPMSNEVITLVKDTALARVIMIVEIIQAAQNFAAYGLIWPLFYTAVFYLIFVGLLTLLFGYFEKKLSYYKV